MSSAEIGGRDTVLGGRLGKTKLIDEDSVGIGAGNTMQTIEEDPETLSVEEEVFDQVEVENRFEELDVISDGVDDFNLQGTVRGFSDLRKVDLEMETQSRRSRGHA